MSKNVKEKWTVRRVLKEVVVTLLLFFVISMLLNYLRQPNITESIYTYNLLDIKEKKVNFSKYKNKPLLVHFWATWCPTCKFEASNIEKISNEYNVITIAVNSGSNRELESYMKQNLLNYRVVNDAQGTLAQKFNIEAYPTTLIYDSKGKLKFTEVGYSTTLGIKARIELLN